MGFFDFFKTIAETKELHRDMDLRSHYYKTNYKKLKAAILEHATDKKLDVRNVDDQHREIFLQSSKYHIIISLVQVTPYETSVDFKIQVYAPVGMNRPRKKILEFYEFLDKALPFKGTSLHP